MALDRRLTLYPSLTASIAGTGAVQLWAQRAPSSRVIATGPTGIYDFSQSVARETAVFRTRWRPDVTLRSIINDDEGNLWFLESIGEVGRRRFLDIACTTYDSVSSIATSGVGRWPYLTTPYTAQSNWGLLDSSNNPVQNIAILRLLAPLGESGGREPPAEGSEPGPRIAYPDTNNRVGWSGLRFNAVNAGYSGTFPVALNTDSDGRYFPDVQIDSANTTHVQILTEDGFIGRMGISGSQYTSGYTLESDDAWIPVGDTNLGSDDFGNTFFDYPSIVVTFDGITPPALGVGSSIRVLSTQELSN